MFKFIDAISQDNKIAILIVFISALTGWFLKSKSIKINSSYEIAKEQLFKVYCPLFQFLEPFLYRKTSSKEEQQIICFCDNLFKENYLLITSETLNSYQIFKRTLIKHENDVQQAYDYFCKSVDKTFEKLKRKLKYPKRKFDYKINNNQLKSETQKLLDEIEKEIINFSKHFVVAIIFFIVVYAIFVIVYFFLSLLGITQS